MAALIYLSSIFGVGLLLASFIIGFTTSYGKVACVTGLIGSGLLLFKALVFGSVLGLILWGLLFAHYVYGIKELAQGKRD